MKRVVALGVRRALSLLVALVACGGGGASKSPALSPTRRALPVEALPPVDTHELLALTRAIAQSERRVFSLLISKNGQLVYELYTSHLTRDHAHYVMSVTKSFTSALMGIAIGEGSVPGPRHERARRAVPPHRSQPDDVARQKAFFAGSNRRELARGQALLPEPGVSYQYTDITPRVARGIIRYAAEMTMLEYADAKLFGPLEFRNHEWMHEDRTGIDNGA